jgi:hypothetical protein
MLAMSDHATTQRLADALFADQPQGVHVYAILDGAASRDIIENIYALTPEFECLYSGELEPDLLECAPYLVELERGHPFTEWFLAECWGMSRAVIAGAPIGIRDMRKHLRSLLLVLDPEGKQMYFRFYDPRVLRVYLPTCTPEELQRVFGPLLWTIAEDETPDRALRFGPKSGEPEPIILRRRIEGASGDGSSDNSARTWPTPSHFDHGSSESSSAGSGEVVA